MALQGIYNFKGIELNDAYLKVQNVACSKNSIIRENLVSEAEYGENGEVTKEAQWEKQEEYAYDGNARVLVYKDKQTREKSFRESVTNFNLPFVIKVALINQVQMQIGGLEVQKTMAIEQLRAFQEELQVIQTQLEEKYGKVSVNLTDGTISELPEDEADKKD